MLFVQIIGSKRLLCAIPLINICRWALPQVDSGFAIFFFFCREEWRYRGDKKLNEKALIESIRFYSVKLLCATYKSRVGRAIFHDFTRGTFLDGTLTHRSEDVTLIK